MTQDTNYGMVPVPPEPGLPEFGRPEPDPEFVPLLEPAPPIPPLVLLPLPLVPKPEPEFMPPLELAPPCPPMPGWPMPG